MQPYYGSLCTIPCKSGDAAGISSQSPLNNQANVSLPALYACSFLPAFTAYYRCSKGSGGGHHRGYVGVIQALPNGDARQTCWQHLSLQASIAASRAKARPMLRARMRTRSRSQA